MRRGELHVGELADELRPRGEGVPVSVPGGNVQGLDPDHERRHRLAGGKLL